jgi:hypothetical protein
LKKLNGVSDSIFFAVWCGFFIYTIWMEASQGNWLFAAWCSFIISLGVSSLISGRIRTRAIKRFASDHTLVYLGDLVPDGLILYFTSFNHWCCSTRNCLHGTLRGIPLAVFDLSHRRGRGSVSQTIVAFPRTGPHAIPEATIDAVGSCQFEAAGDWIIAWIPRRTVRVEELEDWCMELHTLARDLLAESRGEPDARPRLFRWMT